MYELDEKSWDAGGAIDLAGRHEVDSDTGVEAIGRGMEEGEAGRVTTEERGSDDGGVIITGKATAG